MTAGSYVPVIDDAFQRDALDSMNSPILVSSKPIEGRIIAAGGLGSRLPVYPDADTALCAGRCRDMSPGG